MKDSNALIRAALIGLVAMGVGAFTMTASAGKAGMEKCAGIVKAGKNDCGTSAHACAGQSTKNGDAQEWVYVPVGTCDKIVGAKVVAAAPKK
ncbi:MAG: DUF2282 domain-containing protein [Sulfuricaulis sp.]|nr:DUF2282 domain-containing protein [Sulfuricaulis sp.]